MTNDEFFAWLRSQQSDGRLTQDMVDGANELLDCVTPEMAQVALAKINGWQVAENEVLMSPIANPPRITKADIIAAAERINVEPAMIKAISDIESRGGFNSDNTPKILFERHKFWQGLTAIKWFTVRNNFAAKFPDVCSQSTGAYNARPQFEKLRIAATLNWEVAHESASWGAFQIMGYHWQSLGYTSITEFIMMMYVSEINHLDALCRFLKLNNLDRALRNKDWAGFAKGYNGVAYKKNQYDTKLASAYNKAKREGW